MFAFITISVAALTSLAQAVTVPNPDTPLFYLVSTGSTSANNDLLPLRMNPSGPGTASLTGSGIPARFYFAQGKLTIYDPDNNTFPYRPLINTLPGADGCQTFGALTFVQGTSTNKCASYNTFLIQSNAEDSQLGSELVFDSVGGFYACGGGQEVRDDP
ncbi:hypothetical protein D9613_009581 [Agrocybe pediades]|uniref:Uncharacterized protein n=1 Tax=Agrocybe pediades TaxID=84607 RepID=A0A8H4R451_9AGAR|nr:hypothetical protein D9613_009581 [Agrocybe pediades]